MPAPGSTPPPRPILDLAGVTLRVGGLTCLADVSLRQRRGTVLAVVGPNGAGKTALLDCLTGSRRPSRGSAHFWPARGPGGPVELFGRSAPAVARLGIARTFRETRLFDQLTVLDNVRVGVEAAARGGTRRALVPGTPGRGGIRAARSAARELLDLVGLADRAAEPAAGLPRGARRRLEVASALGTRPSLLLLDEPAAGVPAAERAWLAELVGQVQARGVSVLLAEHDPRLALAVADTVVVLEAGAVVATGTPAEVVGSLAALGAYRAPSPAGT
ncbi:hypothetical protein BCD49_19655 [Pseudofrankia sp. EUN1h]|nr:hypothetical protein BCD49_19655 [Pseudofrankia sp. EUN1h]